MDGANLGKSNNSRVGPTFQKQFRLLAFYNNNFFLANRLVTYKKYKKKSIVNKDKIVCNNSIVKSNINNK